MRQRKPSRRFNQQEVRRTADQLANLLQRVFQRHGDQGSALGVFPISGQGDGGFQDGYRRAMPGDRPEDYHTRLNAMQGPQGSLYVHTRPNRYERRGVVIGDISGNPQPGSDAALYEREELTLLAAELLLRAAFDLGHKPGLILPRGSNAVRKVAPDSSEGLLFRHLNEASKLAGGSNLPGCLTAAEKLSSGLEFAIIISDFLSKGWESNLLSLGRKVELVVFQIIDPWDFELPDIGRTRIRQNGQVYHMNTSKEDVRKVYRKKASERQARLQDTLRQARADHHIIETTSPILDQFAATLQSGRRTRQTA